MHYSISQGVLIEAPYQSLFLLSSNRSSLSSFVSLVIRSSPA
jgi:hypothetical protein